MILLKLVVFLQYENKSICASVKLYAGPNEVMSEIDRVTVSGFSYGPPQILHFLPIDFWYRSKCCFCFCFSFIKCPHDLVVKYF